MEDLIKRIHDFISKYASVSPNWDGESVDEKYTAPDIYQLLDCAYLLEEGIKPSQCWSDWGCGGYKPYTSKEGRKEHDELVKDIYKIINTK